MIAELPGGSRADEVVMIGAHLDSWHGGTGATDNAAGCAVMLEAMRILKTLDLKLDRSVRLALWTGEEQGIYGSRAYVKRHFGDPVTMRLEPEHAKLAAYFNVDNGTGKIRGVYLQGNDMVRPIFEAWLAPFADLGARTLTIRDTHGTDHLSFDAVGLPGFQFIQDPVDYGTRTHHSDLDVYDHLQRADLMQAAAIVASFVYNAATRREHAAAQAAAEASATRPGPAWRAEPWRVTPAVASLVALLLAIALSFSARVNVGVAALALAFGLGLLVPGLRAEAVAGAFPSSLFLTLLGVTLLFAATEANGTLARVARRAVRLARGDARVVPWLLFAVAFCVSAVGPGAVPSVALVAPLAAAVAAQMSLSPFLGALFVANGANAGNLSPLSAVGIIANSRMAEAGLVGHEGKVFAANALAHLLVTAAAYAFWLWRRPLATEAALAAAPAAEPLDARQRLSFVVIAAWAAGRRDLPSARGPLRARRRRVPLRVPRRGRAEDPACRPLGRRADGERDEHARVARGEDRRAWSSSAACSHASPLPATVNGAMAFVTGLVSTWSSTSGVVLPAFLPTVPGLLARLGGGDPARPLAQHQRRLVARRRLAALDARRAVRGRGRGSERRRSRCFAGCWPGACR